MRQMLPEYLRQFLLVAAADEYFRECTRTGFPFIMEDMPGHKTFLTSSETTDSVFAALDASTVGKETFPAAPFKKPSEYLQRPPVVRSFDFPARRGARPTMVHTSGKNSSSALQEPFLKLTNSIKHPNLPQQNSNAVQKKRRYPLMKISRPSRRRGPDRRRGWQAQAPLAVTFRFHVPVGDWNA